MLQGALLALTMGLLCGGITIFDSNLIVRRNALGDSLISESSRDFIFGDLDEDRDGLISTEELKEVLHPSPAPPRRHSSA